MAVRLDHDIVMSHDNLIVEYRFSIVMPTGLAGVSPHDCAYARALGQIKLFDTTPDDFRRARIAVRHELERLCRPAPQRVHCYAITTPHASKQGADRRLRR